MSSNDFHGQLLKSYYRKVFPSELFCKWLSYGNNEALSNREFSFTLEGDIYIRYKSFVSVEEFSKELCNINPFKIDIGAVYNRPPKYNKQTTITPMWKELVFDIDMTDYDDVRFCCEKANICNKCWTLMTVAIKVLDRALRDDFGFSKIMWVYSGRRGVHCWVSDKEARELKSNERSAIVGYLSLVKRCNDKKKKVKLPYTDQWVDNLHPSITRSIDIIRKYFEKYAIIDQRVLDTESGISRVLDTLSDEFSESRDKLKSLWKPSEDNESKSMKRWKTLSMYLEDNHMAREIDEIMLDFLNLRLDANVSTSVNHLLKSPFSVHPSTGRICVPIDIDLVDEFDPLSVPTLEQVLKELGVSKDIRLTSAGKYVEYFEQYVAKLMESE